MSLVKILIADDNHDSVYCLKMILELMGNEIHVAYDGLAAFTMAQDLHPDLILLDITMPKLNGLQVLEHIKEHTWSQEMIIVALSGHLQQRLGLFNYSMLKPLNFSLLESNLLKNNHMDINPKHKYFSESLLA